MASFICQPVGLVGLRSHVTGYSHDGGRVSSLRKETDSLKRGQTPTHALFKPLLKSLLVTSHSSKQVTWSHLESMGREIGPTS